MFIVIDWIDGSWKWTQVELLRKHYESIWKKVKILDYPRHGMESAFMVKKYLNWEYGREVSPKLASIFFAIDRYDSFFSEKNRIDLCEYDYVISNRYVSANMIHQAWKIKSKKQTKEFLDWLYDLEFNIFWIPKPDKVIFLNVTPEVSQKLVLKKEQREYLEWKKMDIHEEDINHLKDSWQKAMDVVDMYDDWIKIDCIESWDILPIETITQKIIFEIEKNNNQIYLNI